MNKILIASFIGVIVVIVVMIIIKSNVDEEGYRTLDKRMRNVSKDKSFIRLTPESLSQNGYDGYTHDRNFQNIQNKQDEELFKWGVYDTGSFYDNCINKCVDPMSNGCKMACMNLTNQNELVQGGDDKNQYGNVMKPKSCMTTCQEGCLQIYDEPLPYNINICNKACRKNCNIK